MTIEVFKKSTDSVLENKYDLDLLKQALIDKCAPEIIDAIVASVKEEVSTRVRGIMGEYWGTTFESQKELADAAKDRKMAMVSLLFDHRYLEGTIVSSAESKLVQPGENADYIVQSIRFWMDRFFHKMLIMTDFDLDVDAHILPASNREYSKTERTVGAFGAMDSGGSMDRGDLTDSPTFNE